MTICPFVLRFFMTYLWNTLHEYQFLQLKLSYPPAFYFIKSKAAKYYAEEHLES